MQELKPFLRRRFKCDFCKNKIYYNESACRRHEDKCYNNPNRNCITCNNKGVEFFATLGNNFDVIFDFDGEKRDCSSCEIASGCGGKSYIEAKTDPLTKS